MLKINEIQLSACRLLSNRNSYYTVINNYIQYDEMPLLANWYRHVLTINNKIYIYIYYITFTEILGMLETLYLSEVKQMKWSHFLLLLFQSHGKRKRNLSKILWSLCWGIRNQRKLENLKFGIYTQKISLIYVLRYSWDFEFRTICGSSQWLLNACEIICTSDWIWASWT